MAARPTPRCRPRFPAPRGQVRVRRPRADLNQYAVVADGRVTTYRVRERAYRVADLRTMLRRHGIALEAAWADLAGAPRRRSSPVLGVIARRA